MATNRRAGRIQLYVNGTLIDAKGNWTYSLGGVSREAIVGADRIHGYREPVAIPMIEGVITDRSDLDVAAMRDLTDTTVQLILGNDKTMILRNAWAAGEWNQTTEEAEIEVSFQGLSAEEQLAE